jgi:hypothetical protein
MRRLLLALAIFAFTGVGHRIRGDGLTADPGTWSETTRLTFAYLSGGTAARTCGSASAASTSGASSAA